MEGSGSATASSQSTTALRQLLSRPELWLGVLVFAAAAYFHGSGSWNQNARLDAIFTFVEPGPHRWTFRIDPFLPFPQRGINTGDWSHWGEHYYANKAPGTMLWGVLGYVPIYLLEASVGMQLDSPPVASLTAYLLNVWISVVPMTVACVLWYRLLSRTLTTRMAAVFTLLTYLGTALFPYATQIWGHPTSAALVMMALWALGDFDLRPQRVLLCGLFLGLAVVFDFLALPIVVAVCLALAIRHPRSLTHLALGGTAPLLLLLAYQAYCFGSPFTLPTAGTQQIFLDDERVLGLFGAVNIEALVQTTVGTYRGIFFQMPLAGAATLGLGLWVKRDHHDPRVWVCIGGFIATLLWISTFNGWHGGASVCARYLIVALPLLMLGLGELPRLTHYRWLVAALALPSLSNMLAIASVSPLVADKMPNPLFNETYPVLFTGNLQPYTLPVRLMQFHPEFSQWEEVTAWNWGDILGLKGLLRLLPLFAVAGLCVWRLLRVTDARAVRS